MFKCQTQLRKNTKYEVGKERREKLPVKSLLWHTQRHNHKADRLVKDILRYLKLNWYFQKKKQKELYKVLILRTRLGRK